MAVAKMEMLHLIGPVEEMERVLQEVVLLENIHIRSAEKSGADPNFAMAVLEPFLEKNQEIGQVRPYRADHENLKRQQDTLAYVEKALGITPVVDKSIDRSLASSQKYTLLETIRQEVAPFQERFLHLSEEIDRYRDFLESIEYLRGLDINLSDLGRMEHFNYHIGTLTKDRRIKLRQNYENIQAVVLHIGSSVDGEAYLIFTPAGLEDASQGLLKSLNFKEIALPVEFDGNPEQVYERIQERIAHLEEELEGVRLRLADLSAHRQVDVNRIYSRILMAEKIELLEQNTAVSANFFFFSGWVPKTATQSVFQILKNRCPSVICAFSSDEQIKGSVTPPTKLSNNWLLAPFEMLVKMYGIPNYREIDPTVFLGITYLLLFGAMFGDVGQGAVLMIGGFLLSRRPSLANAGQLLLRIGLFSTLFGFLYGSVFGVEHVLPALWIRPFDNINYVLLISIVLGVFLLFCSFGLSIYNLLRQKDYENAWFGRNGVVGWLFYCVMLILIVQIALGRQSVPTPALLLGGAALLLMMFFRKSLAGWLYHQPVHFESGKRDYYIEGGFDIIETLLSYFSNTMSFIRVGAFALNHVGLFLAFSVMAEMTQNGAAGFLVMVLGNIIIIALEGLIVFIQSLRLEFYEMFSKYYRGDGIAYEPLQFQANKEE